MLTVSPLHDDTKDVFYKLFEEYYLELGCDDDIPHLFKEYILPDILAGLVYADILKDGETYAGFILYQRDDINNDWNLKEGWGDVREIFVLPSRRRQGLGKFLLYTAEMKLRESGVEHCYCLPTITAEEFFKQCGYTDSGVYNPEMDCNVFEKLSLLNGDCCK